MSRPVIGLNPGLMVRTWKKKPRPRIEIYPTYTGSVELAGGLPMVLPCTGDPEVVEEQLDRIDCLVLTGGDDYAPSLYGQKKHPKTQVLHPERQSYDLMLARRAMERGVPILGICGGHQLINILLGGDLIQHIEDGPAAGTGKGVQHRSSEGRVMHGIRIVPGTRLAAIVQAKRMQVNSSHHQAIGRPADGLRVSARSQDGLIEAVETTGNAFLLCVQWHPESMPDKPKHLALFQALVKASRRT
jgi:putative glutamine amidotransferase